MEQHNDNLSAEEQYAQLAPALDADGFSLYAAAEEVTGLKVYEEFPYEDKDSYAVNKKKKKSREMER